MKIVKKNNRINAAEKASLIKQVNDWRKENEGVSTAPDLEFEVFGEKKIIGTFQNSGMYGDMFSIDEVQKLES